MQNFPKKGICRTFSGLLDRSSFDFGASGEMESCRLGMELRSRIESFGTFQAARQIQRGTDVKPLFDAFFHLSRINLLDDSESFAEADIQLHREILLLSGVPGILESWEPALKTINRFRTATLQICWPDSDSLIEAHRVIVDAIAEGQAELAKELSERHLEQVWSRIAIRTPFKPVYEDPLERACVYILFHYHETLSFQELAESVAGVSVGHLGRLFREKLGKSCTDYLREIRMEKAAGLLLQSSFSIGRISRLVGYADASRFSRHFYHFYQMTPTEYRDCLSFR